jgi:hypothetical protein
MAGRGRARSGWAGLGSVRQGSGVSREQIIEEAVRLGMVVRGKAGSGAVRSGRVGPGLVRQGDRVPITKGRLTWRQR